VAIYGQQDPVGLAEATQRIARRLGPQRTAMALEAIAASDWAAACRSMLDYYDRCYDHDLSSHAVDVVDLGELEAEAAARLLVERGLVQPSRSTVSTAVPPAAQDKAQDIVVAT
jgi:tRNA 2-selenouridine synthase